MTAPCALRAVLLLFTAASLRAGVSGCACDPAQPATMQARECALCREAEKQPPSASVFFLRDNNPRKPHRWLALPRAHGNEGHNLQDMTLTERTALWKAAIQKAKELWSNDWGVAYNGPIVRTQCHAHIHIGKLLQGVENKRRLVVVSSPEKIPVPHGEGVWIHPVGKKLHVHLGEQICETVLWR
jgi:hypothetical protein